MPCFILIGVKKQNFRLVQLLEAWKGLGSHRLMAGTSYQLIRNQRFKDNLIHGGGGWGGVLALLQALHHFIRSKSKAFTDHT